MWHNVVLWFNELKWIENSAACCWMLYSKFGFWGFETPTEVEMVPEQIELSVEIIFATAKGLQTSYEKDWRRLFGEKKEKKGKKKERKEIILESYILNQLEELDKRELKNQQLALWKEKKMRKKNCETTIEIIFIDNTIIPVLLFATFYCSMAFLAVWMSTVIDAGSQQFSRNGCYMKIKWKQ